MAIQVQGALADLLRNIGRMERRLDALQAAETDTGGGGGAGTVTSVALSMPAIFSVSGSPVTTTGTLTATLATQTANYFWAGPTSGGAAAPTFRAMVTADIPNAIVTYAKIQNVTTARMLGRSTAGAGVVEEISVGSGLSLAAGTLSSTVTGTVTSVALSLPAIFSVSGSPVTTAGTLAVTLASQSANLVLAGPTGGGAAAPTFRALVAADIPALSYGTGTVTSVALSLPAIFSVSGSPVTTSGTLTGTLATQTANYIWAGPTTGAAAAPTFRAMVAADVPNSLITYAKIQNMTTARLLGRTTAGSGVVEEISVGAGLTLTAGVLNTAGGGSVTGSGTSGKLAKFTGASALGDSIVTESGAAISVAGTITAVGSSDTNQLVVKSHSTQSNGQIVIQDSAGAELARIKISPTYSMGIGYQAGANVSGANNLAIGKSALQTQTTGTANLAIGNTALRDAGSSAHDNTAIGPRVLETLTSGQYNCAIGSTNLYLLSTGINNCAIGTNSCLNVTGSGNCGLGVNTFYYSGAVSDNVGIGWAAGLTCGGDRNTLIGTWAGYSGGGSAVAFSDSVYIGNKSGYGSNVGSYNVAVGGESLQKVITGATAVGYKAGYVATGAGQVLIGYQAGVAVTTGTNNTIVGYQAGASLSTNGGSVMIGYQAGNAETAANKLYIANSSTTTPLIYGDFSTPSLTFNGTVNIQDAKNIVLGSTTGNQVATATTQKLAFHGSTPVIQRAGAAQAAVGTTAATNSSPYGYTTAAQADAIVALVNEIRAALVEKGLIKGAA